jgi:hypothetical protein
MYLAVTEDLDGERTSCFRCWREARLLVAVVEGIEIPAKENER